MVGGGKGLERASLTGTRPRGLLVFVSRPLRPNDLQPRGGGGRYQELLAPAVAASGFEHPRRPAELGGGRGGKKQSQGIPLAPPADTETLGGEPGDPFVPGGPSWLTRGVASHEEQQQAPGMPQEAVGNPQADGERHQRAHERGLLGGRRREGAQHEPRQGQPARLLVGGRGLTSSDPRLDNRTDGGEKESVAEGRTEERSNQIRGKRGGDEGERPWGKKKGGAGELGEGTKGEERQEGQTTNK